MGKSKSKSKKVPEQDLQLVAVIGVRTPKGNPDLKPGDEVPGDLLSENQLKDLIDGGFVKARGTYRPGDPIPGLTATKVLEDQSPEKDADGILAEHEERLRLLQERAAELEVVINERRLALMGMGSVETISQPEAKAKAKKGAKASEATAAKEHEEQILASEFCFDPDDIAEQDLDELNLLLGDREHEPVASVEGAIKILSRDYADRIKIEARLVKAKKTK